MVFTMGNLSSYRNRSAARIQPKPVVLALLAIILGLSSTQGFGSGGDQDVTTTTGTASGSFPYAVENVGDGNSVLFKLGTSANTISLDATYPTGLATNKSINFSNSDTGNVVLDFGSSRTNAYAWAIAGGTVSLGTNLDFEAGFGGTTTIVSLIYGSSSIAMGDLNSSLYATGGSSNLFTTAIYAEGDIRVTGNCDGRVSALSATRAAAIDSNNGNISILGDVSNTIVGTSSGDDFAFGICASAGSISLNNVTDTGVITATNTSTSLHVDANGIYAYGDVMLSGSVSGSIAAVAACGNATAVVSGGGNVLIHNITSTGVILAASGSSTAVGIEGSTGIAITNLDGSIQAEGANARGLSTGMSVQISECSGTISVGGSACSLSQAIYGGESVSVGTLTGVISATGTRGAWGIDALSTMAVGSASYCTIADCSGTINATATTGSASGIAAGGSISIGALSGLVTASGSKSGSGIYSRYSDVTINDLSGTVTATSDGHNTYGIFGKTGVTINSLGGSVSAADGSDSYGINSNGSISVQNLTGAATASGAKAYGILAYGGSYYLETQNVGIDSLSGTVSATAATGNASGIGALYDVTIGTLSGEVAATSGTAGYASGIQALNGSVSIGTLSGNITAQSSLGSYGISSETGLSINNLSGSIHAASDSFAVGVMNIYDVLHIGNLSGTVTATAPSSEAYGIFCNTGITIGTLSGAVTASGSSTAGAVYSLGDINGGNASTAALVTGTVSAAGANAYAVASMGDNADGMNLKAENGSVLSAVSTSGTGSAFAVYATSKNNTIELVSGCTIVGDIYMNGSCSNLLILSGAAGSTTLTSNITTDELDVTGGHWILTGTLAEKTVLDINSDAAFQCNSAQTVAALTGSGTLSLQDSTLTVSGTTSSTFTGVLADAGGTAPSTLLKTGSGYLNFAGTCTNVNLDVSGGTLAFNGSSNGSATVETTGVFGGTGTLASLTNYGTVAPGNSIGTVTTGAFTNAKSSTLAIQVNGAGQSDVIAVTGTADIQGGTVRLLAESGSYRTGMTYTFLTANSISGTFDAVTDNWLFLNGSLVYGAQTIQLLLSPVNFTTVAQTFNQYGVANYLDATRATAMGDFATVIDTITMMDNASAARAAFDAMSGEVFGSLSTIGIEDHERFLRTISQRLQSQTIRQDADNFAAGDCQKGLVYVIRDTSASAGWTTWAEGYGVGAAIASNGNASGLGYSSGGVAVGMERQVSDSTKLGMAGGYSSSYATLDARRDNASIDGGSLALYVHRRIECLYWTGIAAYGYNSYNTERQIAFATLDREAHANYGGNNFSFYTEAGRTICGERFHLQPYVGLEYIQLHQEDFVENGANSIDILTGGVQADAFRSMIGSRILANLPTKSGRPLALEGRAAWRHEFLNENRIIDASFAGQTGTNFAVAGINVDRDAAIVGAGLMYRLRTNLSVFGNYDALTSGNYTAHAGSGGLQFQW